MPPNPRQPLVNFLGVQRRVDASLNDALARAARDAERRVRALELGPQGIGTRVRAAQLRGVLAAIREQQQELWNAGVGPLITENLAAAQQAAVDAALTIDGVLFDALPQSQAEVLAQSAREMATAGMRNDAARQAVNLSPRVYKNADLASGAIEATIRSGIIQGLSARELAQTVRMFIDPATPGGVSYAAKRLARTELNNAFHSRQVAAADQPWVDSVKWNLSGSHPRIDKCNEYAEKDSHDLGTGCFPKNDVPDKPHPFCLCFMTYELMAEADFVRHLAEFVRAA